MKLEEVMAAGYSAEASSYTYTDIPQSAQPAKYYIKALHKDDLVIRSETIEVALVAFGFCEVISKSYFW